MKTNKLLSLLTAAAISVTSFAALTITASAAEPITETYTVSSGEAKSYAAGDTIYSGTLFTVSADVAIDQDAKGFLKGSKVDETTVTIDSNGTTKKFRDALAITPKESGTLTVTTRVGDTKTVAMWVQDSASAVACYTNNTGDVINNYQLTANVTAGTTYIVGGAATDPYWYGVSLEYTEMPKVTVTSDVQKVSTDTTDAGDPAIGFMATFDITGTMDVSGCKWTAKVGSASDTADSTLETTTEITDGSVVFGLVVTIPKDKADQIGDVTADAVLY